MAVAIPTHGTVTVPRAVVTAELRTGEVRGESLLALLQQVRSMEHALELALAECRSYRQLATAALAEAEALAYEVVLLQEQHAEDREAVA